MPRGGRCPGSRRRRPAGGAGFAPDLAPVFKFTLVHSVAAIRTVSGDLAAPWGARAPRTPLVNRIGAGPAPAPPVPPGGRVIPK